jgi:hypothetical protein
MTTTTSARAADATTGSDEPFPAGLPTSHALQLGSAAGVISGPETTVVYFPGWVLS